MLIPLCFFNRYVNVDDKDLIVNSLVNLGIEVENVYKVGYETDNVKIGKIVEKVKHPNADKIWVCKVDLENELLQILTADESVEVDDIVLVALPGCSLPTGLKIDKRNIRGIDSFGMMLSCRELGWDNVKSYGLGVSKFNFDEKISKSIGKYLKDVIKMSDYVIEIKPLANKVETLSAYHLCKEISFVLNTSFNDILILKNSEMFDSKIEKIGINLESSDCRYYKAIFLEDVKIDYSPIEMQLILSWMGTKPVNNIVDITNFLMYELAQPLHAFDEDGIYKKIVVRKAKNGEVLHALDGKDYELINDDLVISDEENKILALAGIIGSRNYSVKENTKKIVIEIAKFLPSTIRRTSKRLGLYTNSSKRFDKNIPDIYVDYAHNRLISLLNEFKVKYRYIGFNYSGFKEDAKILSFSKQKINEYIGINFQEDDIKNFLNVIGEDFSMEGDRIVVKTFRSDINYWWDVAEELCRFKGFNNIVSEALKDSQPEKIHHFGKQTRIFKEKIIDYIENLKRKLVSNGYYEVIGYNLLSPKYLEFLGEDFLKIDNYMSAEHAAYRNSIIPSILKIASDNYKAGYKNIKIFEIGKVFKKKESYELGIVVYNENKSFIFNPQSYVINEIQRIKSIFGDLFLIPANSYNFFTRGYEIYQKERKVGFIGILNHSLLKVFSYPPSTLVGVFYIEDLFSNISDELYVDKDFNISYYPPIYKDISFYVDKEINYDMFYKTVMKTFQENLAYKMIISNLYLIDIYQMDDAKSYTFRLEIKPLEELTNEDINKVLEGLFEKLNKEGIKRR